MARRMVMEWGMSDRLGPLQYGRPEHEVFLGRDYSRPTDMSDEVAALVDEEIRYLITQAHDEARQILTTHHEALERIAEVLIEKETVDADDLAEIFYDVPKWEHDETGALRIKAPAPNVHDGTLIATARRTDEPGSPNPTKR
jgi:cell division protease FtsH